MRLSRLTTEGIDRFRDYLAGLKTDPKGPVPLHLLTEQEYASVVDDGPEVDQRVFKNRLEAAQYVDELLAATELAEPERDVGLWSWLTLYYFDQLCPVEKRQKKVGEEPTYIPRIDVARRVYRHLLLGPWQMLRLHRDNPDRLRGLLWTAPSVATAETYRLFVENSSLLAAPCAVSAATTLYFDGDHGKMKRGAGRKEKGGCRRLIEYLQQIDCTFDLPLLSEASLIQMLPKEFQPFIPSQQHLFDKFSTSSV